MRRITQSGGTLICLAANEIVLSSHAVIGPIDLQVGDSPAASLIKVIEQKPISEIDDRTLVMADIARKAIEQFKCAARELLRGRSPAEQADELAAKLSEGRWTHDYPISAAEAKSMGLNVSTSMKLEDARPERSEFVERQHCHCLVPKWRRSNPRERDS